MRRRRRTTTSRCAGILASLLLLVLAAPAGAQVEAHPGYFPVEELGFMEPEDLSLEINLAGSMLELIAAAFDDEDPEFSELVRGLQGIRVRIAETEDLELPTLEQGFKRATAWLDENGWEAFIRLREDDEQLHVFMRVVEGDMVGTTVLILEPEDQVVVVNVVGRLDLALLAQLADSLDIPALDIEGFEPDRRRDADGGH